jgi:hypothetical protein
MFLMFEHFLLGAALVATGALGIAAAARWFSRDDPGADHFFVTAVVSVALVGLFVAGVFFQIHAVFDADTIGVRVAVGVGDVVLTVAAPLAAWRLFGPKINPGVAGAAS